MISTGRPARALPTLAILAALSLALLGRGQAQNLPEQGSRKGIDWRPSGFPGVVYARFDPKGVEIPVALAELEREITKQDAAPALLARWLLYQREMAGARWDATLRTYYPDAESGPFGKPQETIELPLDEETTVTVRQDDAAEWYARITTTGDKYPPRSVSRPFILRTAKEGVIPERDQARQIVDCPYILPEELRPRVAKLTREEFRAALVASKELESASFMRLHKAYAALAKETGHPGDIYPKGVPPLPQTTPAVPPSAKADALPPLDAPPPSTIPANLGTLATIAAALVLVVLALSVFWRRSS